MREAIHFTFILAIIVAAIILTVIWPVYGFSAIGIFIFGLGLYDIFQKKEAVLRNFPVISLIRFLLQLIAPLIHSYKTFYPSLKPGDYQY